MATYKTVTDITLQEVVLPTTTRYYIAKFAKAELQTFLNNIPNSAEVALIYGTDSVSGTPLPSPPPHDVFLEVAMVDPNNDMPIHVASNPKEYLPCPPYCHQT